MPGIELKQVQKETIGSTYIPVESIEIKKRKIAMANKVLHQEA